MNSNTTHSIPSASSSITQSWEHDVFLNHRGADTGTNFAAHLYSSFHQKGLTTFQDDELNRTGEQISPILLKAIEESRIAIIIFSENYASSTWCLDELVKILECKESKDQIVCPIFYKVDPSAVRSQRGCFAEAFDHLESRFHDPEKVMTWRMALRQAANLHGWHLVDGQHEAKFIQDIVDEISLQILNRTYLHVAKYPVGIESRVQDVDQLLGVGVRDIRMIGIWGVEGIGKTTIAKAVYNSIAHKFEASCFLENVGENAKAPRGLLQLQNSMLYEILKGRKLEVTSVDKGITVIKQRLRLKRVLLILDDVDHLDQLNKLAGASDWFGLGSRIIITTKDHDLLTSHQVDLAYKVEGLDTYEAYELFSRNAFYNNRVPDEYRKLAERVVDYAEGLPSTLTAVGSRLCGRRIDEWKAVVDGYEKVPPLDIDEIQTASEKTEVERDLQEEGAPRVGQVENVPAGEWFFLLISFILEFLSAACDQLSSPTKPYYAITGVTLALSGLLSCIVELVLKGRKEKVEFGWCGMVCWYYCPSSGTLFGTFPEIYGLICGISQCASSILQCVCVLRNRNNPIKANILPVIFLGCFISSKLIRNCRRAIITEKTIELKTIAIQ